MAAPARIDARRSRGDRTRAALVMAALELFAAKGVEATAVDEITSAADVAKGTFYVHFHRKPDVLLEHAAQILALLADAPAPADPVAALNQLAAGLADLLQDTPRGVAGRMAREIVGNRDAWLRVLGGRLPVAELVAPVVERGQADGTLRGDLSARRLAQSLTILWLDSIIGWAERPVVRPLDIDLGRATALFLDGARRVSEPRADG